MPLRPGNPLYGMSQAQLQALLTQAQTAYGNLMMGARAVTLSYSQGDGGSKSVTYDRVEGGVAQIRLFIAQLQQALGNTRRLPRRHVRFGMGWR